MQNNIYNFALRSNEINTIALCEMCDMMESSMRDRFVTAILGIVDHKEIAANLSETSRVYGNDNCRLVSFNYLTDRVDYAYDKTVTRYFKTEEEARRLTEEGRGRWDGTNKKTDEYPFEGSYVFHETGSCGMREWTNGVE